MRRFACFLFLGLVSFCLASDRLVISVDSNNVVNVNSLMVPSIVATNSVSAGVVFTDSVNFNEDRAVDGSGFSYRNGGNGVVVIAWPTEYASDYTNYPGMYGPFVDPIATLWFVSNSMAQFRLEMAAVGDKSLYDMYTNNPPENIASLIGYVSNCIYRLSGMNIENSGGSSSSVSNELNLIKTRLARTEITSNRFGGGSDELDYIIDSNINSVDSGDMLEMIKILATYIKTGTTNSASSY